MSNLIADKENVPETGSASFDPKQKEQMTKLLNSLLEKNKTLMADNQKLVTENQKYTQDNTRLSNENRALNSRQDKLKADMDKKIGDISKNLESFNSTQTHLVEENASLRSQWEKQKEYIISLEKKQELELKISEEKLKLTIEKATIAFQNCDILEQKLTESTQIEKKLREMIKEYDTRFGEQKKLIEQSTKKFQTISEDFTKKFAEIQKENLKFMREIEKLKTESITLLKERADFIQKIETLKKLNTGLLQKQKSATVGPSTESSESSVTVA